MGEGSFLPIQMEGPSALPPGQSAGVAARPAYPLWAAIALMLSGMFLMVVETPNLLFFLGLALTLLGLYVFLRERGGR